MKMGRCCKNLWTCWENWNHTNHKKKKSTSIPNDDVLKSTHVLHKCHISCQANDRVKGWPTPTRVQVHTFAYASEPILGSTQETARPFQTYLLKCVESWFSLLSFFKCHVSSLVSIFFKWAALWYRDIHLAFLGTETCSEFRDLFLSWIVFQSQ